MSDRSTDGSTETTVMATKDGLPEDHRGPEDDRTTDALVQELWVALAALRDALAKQEASTQAEFEHTVAALKDQLATKDRQLAEKDQQLAVKNRQIQELKKPKGLVPHLRVLLFGVESARAA